MSKRVLRGIAPVAALIGAIVLFEGDAIAGRAVAAGGQRQSATEQLPQRFTAVAQNLGGRGRAGARTVEIQINHWSTDAQRDQLLAVLRDKGENAMLSALQKLPAVGTIRTPDSLAYDLHYARSQPWDDGGEQVLIATDRPIGYWEAANAGRSMQYPFTVIQMRIKGNGKGDGRMSYATKVIAAGREIVLENYDTQPVMLSSITREK